MSQIKISGGISNHISFKMAASASIDLNSLRPGFANARRIIGGKVEPKEVAVTTRLQKSLAEYSATTGGGAKAARYFNEHLLDGGKRLSKGDSVDWVYVTTVPDGLPRTDVVAFTEPSDLDGFSLDYETMVDKLVKAKIMPIFRAMNWDWTAASGAVRPKNYFG